ncbi:DUF262 domain-containing protein, partial [Desulfovibrio sp. OttesenSCG-928-F20]|nr:DUF262 domain-containing protein [Desulfovibrio sp. OttesenSCG-928-F20]
VTNLLEDFTSFAQQKKLTDDAVYFLQPIVVSRLEDSGERPCWELIDGQQRLTTIYLMDAVLREILATRSDLSFDLVYESRPGSAAFLKKLAENPGVAELPEADDYMDYYHMYQACHTIHTYFAQKDKEQGGLIRRLYQKFTGNVRVLWYDTTDEDGSSPVERFSRLNMGRIPLTGAELSRALLLNTANHDLSDDLASSASAKNELADYLARQLAQQAMTRRQTVLGSRWDDIERELRDPDFWAFLGGKVSDTRATRIDFLLDLYTDKPAGETKKYFAFDKLSEFFDPASENYKGQDAQKIWDDITSSYQMLKFWYEDHDYYHWIGYLSDRGGSEQVRSLLQQARAMRKSEFKDIVFSQIRKSVSKNEALPDLETLQYKKDDKPILNLLFLFNVEYARRSGRFYGCRQAGRFPFGTHREHDWSLEHIQAQNVERLQRDEDWTAWVQDHQRVLREIHGESLPQVAEGNLAVGAFIKQKEDIIAKCQKFLDRPKKERAGEEFVKLSESVLEFIENLRHDREQRKHSLFNLALLDIKQNIVLSNSIFAVKCQLLLKMRKAGEYVPIATEALFMRRFSEEDRHLPYWSEQDQKGYENAVCDVLSTFEWKATDEEDEDA